MTLRVFDYAKMDESVWDDLLGDSEAGVEKFEPIAKEIVDRVRAEGDAAVKALHEEI